MHTILPLNKGRFKRMRIIWDRELLKYVDGLDSSLVSMKNKALFLVLKTNEIKNPMENDLKWSLVVCCFLEGREGGWQKSNSFILSFLLEYASADGHLIFWRKRTKNKQISGRNMEFAIDLGFSWSSVC